MNKRKLDRIHEIVNSPSYKIKDKLIDEEEMLLDGLCNYYSQKETYDLLYSYLVKFPFELVRMITDYTVAFRVYKNDEVFNGNKNTTFNIGNCLTNEPNKTSILYQSYLSTGFTGNGTIRMMKYAQVMYTNFFKLKPLDIFNLILISYENEFTLSFHYSLCSLELECKLKNQPMTIYTFTNKNPAFSSDFHHYMEVRNLESWTIKDTIDFNINNGKLLTKTKFNILNFNFKPWISYDVNFFDEKNHNFVKRRDWNLFKANLIYTIQQSAIIILLYKHHVSSEVLTELCSLVTQMQSINKNYNIRIILIDYLSGTINKYQPFFKTFMKIDQLPSPDGSTFINNIEYSENVRWEF